MKSPQATILVVDDEEMLRQFMARALQQKGYQVLTASDGLEALKICEARHREIDLLLTDVTMPQMTGDELAAKTFQAWPEIQTLMISGYSNHPFLRERRNDGPSHFLRKPFTGEELTGRVRQLLEGSGDRC